MNTLLFVDWLGTFALHSTCALGGAWLVGAVMGRRATAFQERLLRFALWAGLASASLQCAVFGSPFDLSLPQPVAALAAVEPAASAPAGVPVDLVGAPASGVAVPWPDLPSGAVLLAAAAGLAFAGILWLAVVLLRLRSALRCREPETDPRVLAAAAEVARGMGLQQSPRLSRSGSLATPIAFGWLRPEICLPARAGELGDEPLRALLAHEVAHLRRGDPAWTWFATVLQALFPWQLLLFAVRRRWARLVELRCDALAARQSSPTAVARCLLDVAEWMRPGAAVPAVALGMAARPSALRERIEVALQERPPEPPRRALSLAFCSASLSSLTLLAPGLVSGPEQEALGETLPAAAPPEVGEDVTLREFRSLEQECTALAEQVASLRAEVDNGRASPELEQLVSTLSRRLLVVERLRVRLRALLDLRDVGEARGSR